MRRWFVDYFSNPAEVSSSRHIISIVLGVLLFFTLLIFGVTMVMQLSIFNPDYVASYVDDIDVSGLSNQWLNKNVAPENPVIAKAAMLGISYFEPQIKDQMRSVVRDVYAFFLNRLEEGKLLETIANQKPLVNDVANNIQVVLNVPAVKTITESLGLNPESIKSYINLDAINGYFDLIERMARFQALVVFIKNIYIPLILIVLALIIGIIFAARKVRLISIVLGTTFSIYGILQLLSIIPANIYGKLAITGLNLNSMVNNSLLKFVGDITNMLMIFSAVILFCGLSLIAAYVLVKLRQRAV